MAILNYSIHGNYVLPGSFKKTGNFDFLPFEALSHNVRSSEYPAEKAAMWKRVEVSGMCAKEAILVDFSDDSSIRYCLAAAIRVALIKNHELSPTNS